MKKEERDETIVGGRAFIKPKISIAECKAILNKKEEKYTDEEIRQIRDDMLILVEIDYFHFLKCMKREAEEEELKWQQESEQKEVKIIPLKIETDIEGDLRKAS